MKSRKIVLIRLFVGQDREADIENKLVDIYMCVCVLCKGFPGSSAGKECVCNAGDPGSIPGSRRSPGGGYGNSLRYSCLENPMDRGAWWATVHGVTNNWTQLSD